MSGGSFNYLCMRDAGELVAGANHEELQHMISELARLGPPAQKATELSQEIQADIHTFAKQLQAKLDRIENVWRAMEWMRSNDWSKEQFWIELGKFIERESA